MRNRERALEVVSIERTDACTSLSTRLTVLGVLVFHTMAFGAAGTVDFTRTRFYQFFTDPNPSITNVVFRKEMFSLEIPEAARKQTFCLTKVGDDYLFNVLVGTNDSEVAMAAGSYKSRAWGIINGDLTFSDPAINKQGTPIAGQEFVTRMTANLLLNLGITELVRSSLEWDDTNRRFVGTSTSGGHLIIAFEYADRLPKRAIILNGENGLTKAFIDYEYSQAICNGEIPFRFSRHRGSPTHDVGRDFAVELIKMGFASDRSRDIVLDPVAVFHPRSTGYYSNGVMFTVGASGKARKVMTMAEYQASLPHKISPTKVFGARIFVYSAMSLGLVALIRFLLQNNKKSNS